MAIYCTRCNGTIDAEEGRTNCAHCGAVYHAKCAQGAVVEDPATPALNQARRSVGYDRSLKCVECGKQTIWAQAKGCSALLFLLFSLMGLLGGAYLLGNVGIK